MRPRGTELRTAEAPSCGRHLLAAAAEATSVTRALERSHKGGTGLLGIHPAGLVLGLPTTLVER